MLNILAAQKFESNVKLKIGFNSKIIQYKIRFYFNDNFR